MSAESQAAAALRRLARDLEGERSVTVDEVIDAVTVAADHLEARDRGEDASIVFVYADPMNDSSVNVYIDDKLAERVHVRRGRRAQ